MGRRRQASEIKEAWEGFVKEVQWDRDRQVRALLGLLDSLDLEREVREYIEEELVKAKEEP